MSLSQCSEAIELPDFGTNGANEACSLDKAGTPQGLMKLRNNSLQSFKFEFEQAKTVACILRNSAGAKAFCLARECVQDLVGPCLHCLAVAQQKPSDATRLFFPQMLQVESCLLTSGTVLGSSSFHAQTVVSRMLPVILTAQPRV